MNPTRHGWNGWLPIENSIPSEALTDRRLRRVVIEAGAGGDARQAPRLFDRLRWFADGLVRPERLAAGPGQRHRHPLSAAHHRPAPARTGPASVCSTWRAGTATAHDRHRTRWRRGSCSTSDQRAVGVEFLQGERLYRAHAPAERRRRRARRGATRRARSSSRGGAFNSPQLLMLSGIGPPDVLRRHGIEARVPLPGVGTQPPGSLRGQRRLARWTFPEWAIYQGAAFGTGDPRIADGPSTAPASTPPTARCSRSSRARRGAMPCPDLFCMALVARFDGYEPGYSVACSRRIATPSPGSCSRRHTKNRPAGSRCRAPIRSTRRSIDFNHFIDGGDADLKAVVDGVRFVRAAQRAAASTAAGLDARSCRAADVQSDGSASRLRAPQRVGAPRLRNVRDRRRPRRSGVLDSDFRVHGTRSLRVVDASVFPAFPGFSSSARST